MAFTGEEKAQIQRCRTTTKRKYCSLRKHNHDFITLARQTTNLNYQTLTNKLLDLTPRRNAKFEERKRVHHAS